MIWEQCGPSRRHYVQMTNHIITATIVFVLAVSFPLYIYLSSARGQLHFELMSKLKTTVEAAEVCRLRLQ